MSKHTPGPWNLLSEECDKPYIRIRGSIVGSRYKIANVLTPVYEGVHKREAEETRANARLIAAAPELLEALTALVSNIDAGGATLGAMQDARAIIAKAEGNE